MAVGLADRGREFRLDELRSLFLDDRGRNDDFRRDLRSDNDLGSLFHRGGFGSGRFDLGRFAFDLGGSRVRGDRRSLSLLYGGRQNLDLTGRTLLGLSGHGHNGQDRGGEGGFRDGHGLVSLSDELLMAIGRASLAAGSKGPRSFACRGSAASPWRRATGFRRARWGLRRQNGAECQL
jgi:hypothetical protein